MKGLILSGGKGTRLRPITHTGAKQLIPVANKPILFYGLEAMRAAGINEVGIVVGDTHQEIRKAVGDGSRFGVQVTYIDQEAPLGLAHAVKISRDYLRDEDFVMYLGDNLIRGGLKGLVQEFQRERPQAMILLARVPNPQQFGVAEMNGDQVVRLVEKPPQPKSDLALVGVYLFDRTIFEATDKIEPSWRNELEITDAIQYQIDRGRQVKAHIITGWWKDTGKLEDILEANRMMLDILESWVEGEVDGNSKIDHRVVIEAGARIENSVIRGPAIIGKRTRIINSYVGPFTAVYWGVTIENSEVEHSIILEESVIRNVKGRIGDSLIGRNVEVSQSYHKPASYRLVIGDNCRVGLS